MILVANIEYLGSRILMLHILRGSFLNRHPCTHARALQHARNGKKRENCAILAYFNRLPCALSATCIWFLRSRNPMVHVSRTFVGCPLACAHFFTLFDCYLSDLNNLVSIALFFGSMYPLVHIVWTCVQRSRTQAVFAILHCFPLNFSHFGG